MPKRDRRNQDRESTDRRKAVRRNTSLWAYIGGLAGAGLVLSAFWSYIYA